MDAGLPNERRGSFPRRRNSRSEETETGTAALPVKIGIAMYEPSSADPSASKEPGHLPRLHHYSFKVTWMMYLGTFIFSAVRQGMCVYLTIGGSVGDSVAYLSLVKIASLFGIMLTTAWFLATVLGQQNRDKMICIFTAAASIIHAVIFSMDRRFAAFSLVIPTSLYLGMELPFSPRRGFAAAMLCLALIFQVLLIALVTSLPLLLSSVPVAAQPLVVPVIKMLYVGFVIEVLTAAWERTYTKAASPYLLDAIVVMALVGAETMGVIGLLAMVDSVEIWSNAVKFCAASLVMETNSRSGVVMSLLYNVVGRRYRFSHAAHIFRWGKLWASYCWVCAVAGFAVPAIALKLEVKGSNLSFVRWETWTLLGAYAVQQFLSDIIFLYVQHYLKPARTLDETRARCMVLGESAPVASMPDDGSEEDCQATPLFGASWLGDDAIVQTAEEEYEPAALKLGPLTVSAPVLLMFIFFECAAWVWTDAMQSGIFGSCGASFSLPSVSSLHRTAGACT